MPNVDIQSLARELESASQRGGMVSRLQSSRPGFDLNSAYDVESTLKQWRVASGQNSVGRKVGYANKAMWRVLKLETLVWGHMYDNTVHQADGNSAKLAIPHPRSLKIRARDRLRSEKSH
jgi:2-keto-4-pentenoate hydratase